MNRLIWVILFVVLPACAEPYRLTPAGMNTTIIKGELAQALPGRPIDRCKIIKHLEVPEQSSCLSANAFKNMFRNEAAAAGANVVLLTGLYTPGPTACWHGASGIAISCDDETLQAAGIYK